GEQRLGLGGHDHALDALDARHELRVPRRAWHLRLGEVRGHALADRLGLADVDHAPLPVSEQVHAGLIGKRSALLAQARWSLAGAAPRLRVCHRARQYARQCRYTASNAYTT